MKAGPLLHVTKCLKSDELPFYRFTAVGLLFVSDTAHTVAGVDSIVLVMCHIL